MYQKRAESQGLARFGRASRGGEAVSNAAAYHKRYIAARSRNEFPKRAVRTYRQSVVAGEKVVRASLFHG